MYLNTSYLYWVLVFLWVVESPFLINIIYLIIHLSIFIILLYINLIHPFFSHLPYWLRLVCTKWWSPIPSYATLRVSCLYPKIGSHYTGDDLILMDMDWENVVKHLHWSISTSQHCSLVLEQTIIGRTHIHIYYIPCTKFFGGILKIHPCAL